MKLPTLISILTWLLLSSQTALCLDGQKKAELKALISQGDAFYKKYQFKHAEAAYRESLQIDPACVPALLGMSGIYRHWGQAKVSNSYIQLASKIEPNNPQCYIASAKLFARLNDKEQAIRAYRKAVALSQNDAEVYASLGWEQLEDHPADSEASERRAVKLDPKNHSAYRTLAYALSNQKKYQQAAQAMKTAIALAPKFQWYQSDLAIIYTRASNRKAAQEIYKKMLVDSPKNVEPLLRLADLAAEDNNPKEQEKLLLAATKIKSSNDTAWRELARIYMNQRNLPKALKCARIAQGFKPKNSRNNLILAICLMESGKLVDAEQYAQRAVDTAEDVFNKLNCQFTQVHLKFLIGKNDEAMAEAKEMYKKYPQEVSAQRAMAWALMCFKRYDEGFVILKQAMAKFPDVSVLENDYLEGLLSAERFDETKKVARKMLKKNANDSEAWFCLLEVAKKTKNKTEANEAIKHLSSLNLSADESMEVGFNGINSGMGNRSLPSLKQALERSPESADIILNSRDPLDEASVQSGRKPPAVKNK